MVNQFIVLGKIKKQPEIENNYIKVEIESMREEKIEERTKCIATNLTLYIILTPKVKISDLKVRTVLGFRGYIDSSN